MFVTKASSGMSMVFPDVCKIPAPPPSAGGPGGTPIPYPTFAQTAVKSQQAAKKTPVGGKTGIGPSIGSLSQLSSVGITGVAQVSTHKLMGGSASKAGEIAQLKSGLNQLNAKLQSLNTADPNEWQKVLQDYAVMASALYVTLSS